MSENKTVKAVACPKCSSLGKAEIFTNINVTNDPDFRDKVLEGELFAWTCPSCGCQARLNYPILYNDMKNRFMVYLIPKADRFQLVDKELEQQYVTERSEPNKYLKNILSARTGVRSLFASLALLDKSQDIKATLQRAIDKAAPVSAWNDASPVQLTRFNLAIENLRKNVPLYDYFLSKEWDKHYFRIYWFQGHIMIAISSSTLDRIALDTNRAEIASILSMSHGFYFNDENQKIVIARYGVCFGKEIWLHRIIGKATFWVGFCTEHEVRLQIEFPSEDAAAACSNTIEGSSIIEGNERFLKLPSIQDYPNDAIIDDILNAFTKSETLLKDSTE